LLGPNPLEIPFGAFDQSYIDWRLAFLGPLKQILQIGFSELTVGLSRDANMRIVSKVRFVHDLFEDGIDQSSIRVAFHFDLNAGILFACRMENGPQAFLDCF